MNTVWKIKITSCKRFLILTTQIYVLISFCQSFLNFVLKNYVYAVSRGTGLSLTGFFYLARQRMSGKPELI